MLSLLEIALLALATAAAVVAARSARTSRALAGRAVEADARAAVAESALREERQDHAALLDGMGDAVCVLDADGAIRSVNGHAQRLFGHGAANVVGRNIVDIVSGNWPSQKERRRPLLALREAIAEGRRAAFDDARFVGEGGSWMPVSYVLEPLVLGGRSRGAVLIVRDQRERKRVEAALLENEARFRAIFESAAVGMARIELDGRLAECNRALEEMLGYTAADLRARGIRFSDPSDGARMTAVVADLAAGREMHHRSERRFEHQSGAHVWLDVTMNVVRDARGAPSFAICVIQNTTERKQLELTLRHAQKLESVGRLAAGIAHEINTPIQFIGDNVHFLREAFAGLCDYAGRARAMVERAAVDDRAREELGELESLADVDYLRSDVPRAIEQTLDGIGRVAAIVRAMRTFSHPDRTEEQAPADLAVALTSAITVAGSEIRRVADVETRFAELPPVTCWIGDLNQVFLNLLVNAAHAIGEACAASGARGKIRVETYADDRSVTVAIADTGPGIAEHLRQRVFEPFFTTKEVGRGTGQGLALAHAIVVDKHGGSLTYETKMGVGTTFFVRVPLAGRAASSPRRAA